MAAPIPCLGYRSRTQAAVALRAKGLDDQEIADQLGITANALSGLLASAKRAKRPSELRGRTIVFPVDLLNRLAPHAARRGITVNQLARHIVDAAVDDDLIDAILDDQGSQP